MNVKKLELEAPEDQSIVTLWYLIFTYLTYNAHLRI